MHTLSKYRFWFLNLAFWGSYYLTQASTSPIFLAYPLSNRIVLCLSFIFWILLITSIYRFIYTYFKFSQKGFLFTTIQSFLSVLIMFALDLSARFSINYKVQDFLNNLTFDNNYNAFSRVYLIENSDLKDYVNQTLQNGQVTKLYAYAIWMLLYNFYHYYERLKTIEIEKLKTQNQLKDAELINLRQQLNPHFLFNALNGIHALVSLKDEKAPTAVMNLSDLMRYSLNYGKREFISVEEELEAVRQFLELEKIRFGKRLTFSIEVEEKVKKQQIPFSVVQTLAENAIKHGIQKNIASGYVQVVVAEKVGFVKISIVNSGQLENLDSKTTVSGIGLENIRQRLKTYYGKNFQFLLENKNILEVEATLFLPV